VSYDLYAPHYIQHGFRPVPIAPGSKAPHFWNGREFKLLTGWNTREPLCTPQPGAGLGVLTGHDIVGFDIDTDDSAIVAALKQILPDSPVGKRGQRGETLFYYDPPGRPSRKFKIGGKVVCEILAAGSQTVLPPSVHPKTNKPYEWTNGFDLLDVNDPEADLPRLPDNIEELVAKALAPFGYEPDEEKPEPDDDGEAFDTPCGQLNAAALKRLPEWVPGLGLYNCRRQRGSFPSYVAVASWRPSSTGRSLEARGRNLKITSKGIKDHGDGRTYSAIDLVMAARECDLADAVAWLNEKLGLSISDVEIETILTEGGQSKVSPETPRTEEGKADDKPDGDATQPNQKPRKLRFKLTRWCDMRPGTEQTYLVDELIPIKGIVVLWSPPKSFKSFVALDISLHVALGWEYHDRAVQQGLVVYCAFEGGHGFDKRIEAQRQYYGLEGQDLPMPVLKGMANLITDHKLMVHEIAYQLKTEYAGAKPVAVVLDTLNRSFVGSESKDTDMANYVRAAEAIRAAFDCVCIIIHHCGWDESRPRGHSSLPAAVDAQLSLVRDEDRATLTVEYMRDGVEGTQVLLMKKTVVIGEDDNGKEKTSLVMVRADDDAVAGTPASKRREWPASLQIFHKAVIEAMRGHGFDLQLLNGVVVRAVDLVAAHGVFFKTYVTESDDARRKAWKRALDSAQLKGLISARNEGHREIIWFTAREDDGL
jgi:AAA domain/Bifunctional DNA primase/polymerase, N-terminal